MTLVEVSRALLSNVTDDCFADKYELLPSSMETMRICSVVSVVATVSMLLLACFNQNYRKPPWPLMCRALVCDVAVSCSLLFLSFSPKLFGYNAFANFLCPTCATPVQRSFAIVLGVLLKLAFIAFEMMAVVYRILIWWHAVNIMRNPFVGHRYPKILAGWVFGIILLLIAMCTAFIHGTAGPRSIGTTFLIGPLLAVLVLGLPRLLMAHQIGRKRTEQFSQGKPIPPSVFLQQHEIAVDTFYFGCTLLHYAFRAVIFMLYLKTCILKIDVVFAVAVLRPAISVVGWLMALKYSKWMHVPQVGLTGSLREELRFELVYYVACSCGAFAAKSTETHVPVSFEETYGPDDFAAILQQLGMMASYKASFGLYKQATRTFKPGDELDCDADGIVHKVSVSRDVLRSVEERDQIVAINDRSFSQAALASAKNGERHYKITVNKTSRQPLESGFDDVKQKLKESVSEGASGSFFYRVCAPASTDSSSFQPDTKEQQVGRRQFRQFILKQIDESEFKTLMVILPDYRKHVETTGGKSLIQYVGCQSVSLQQKNDLPKDDLARCYFVVMANILPVKMWLTFDLKGNTMKRRVVSPHKTHGPASEAQEKYSTLRDWDWVDAVMMADVAEKDRNDLKKMIGDDADFLAEQNLVDYSLLLGIHRLPKNLSKEQRNMEIDRLKDLGGPGTCVSADQQKVYFFGIIDVLERYECRWKAQHAVLKAACLLTCRGRVGVDSISAMPPEEYAKRFKTFIFEQVLGLPPEPAEAEARWRSLWHWKCGGLLRRRITYEDEDKRHRIQELENRILELERGSAQQ